MTDGGESLLIISDFIFPQDAIDALTKRYDITRTDRIEKELGRRTGINICARHIAYLSMAFRGYVSWRKNRPAVVVIWQQYIGLYFSLISFFDVVRFMNPVRSKIAVFYILPKRKRIGAMLENVLAAGPVDMLVYAARAEYERSCAGPKRRLLPYADVPLTDSMLDEVKKSEAPVEKYIFSGGTSNRDYAKIRQAALLMPQTDFSLVCAKGDVAGLSMPQNVRAVYDASSVSILSLIYRACCAVISLKDPSVTSGQIMIARALELGTPVLTNLDRKFLKEWLGADGVTGVVHFTTSEELVHILGRMVNDGAYYAKNKESVGRMYDGKKLYAEWIKRFADIFES